MNGRKVLAERRPSGGGRHGLGGEEDVRLGEDSLVRLVPCAVSGGGWYAGGMCVVYVEVLSVDCSPHSMNGGYYPLVITPPGVSGTFAFPSAVSQPLSTAIYHP